MFPTALHCARTQTTPSGIFASSQCVEDFLSRGFGCWRYVLRYFTNPIRTNPISNNGKAAGSGTVETSDGTISSEPVERISKKLDTDESVDEAKNCAEPCLSISMVARTDAPKSTAVAPPFTEKSTSRRDSPRKKSSKVPLSNSGAKGLRGSVTSKLPLEIVDPVRSEESNTSSIEVAKDPFPTKYRSTKPKPLLPSIVIRPSLPGSVG